MRRPQRKISPAEIVDRARRVVRHAVVTPSDRNRLNRIILLQDSPTSADEYFIEALWKSRKNTVKGSERQEQYSKRRDAKSHTEPRWRPEPMWH